MLIGINEKIFSGIKFHLQGYFPSEIRNSAILKIEKLLSLPNTRHKHRDSLASQIIKKQLLQHRKGEIFYLVKELAKVEKVMMNLNGK